MDPADSIAEAVAIKYGKIIAVGSNKDIRKLIGKNTQVIDLKGLTATPGMIDSHIHFYGTRYYILDVSVAEVKSIADIVEKVRARVEVMKPGEWIQGEGWDPAHLAEHRPVYASDLDPVSPDNPVWLVDASHHQGVANSYALNLAGITKDTPDPPGGIIDRYPDGTPTGLLKETAMDLVSGLIPPFTEKQYVEGLALLCQEANSKGLTAILVPGIDLSDWTAFQKVLAQGKLTVRSFMLW